MSAMATPLRRDVLRSAGAGALAAALPGLVTGTTGVPVPDGMHRIQPEFFGLHMVWPTRRPYMENFPAVPVGSWRAYQPELHWFSLEPRPGEWQFGKLDIAMRLMAARKVDVMLTLGEVPTWASSEPGLKGPYVPGQIAPPRRLVDWENYVRTVAQRYQGRIRHYELWNEPTVREVDGKRAHFTAGQLVELGQAAYRIIKDIDPQARLTTPAMVGGEKGVARMEAYLSAGGKRCCDIVAFHYYGLPEQIPPYHAALLKVLARHGLAHLPVWNTESGFLIADPTTPSSSYPVSGGAFSRVLPEQEAAAWVARSLILAASAGIERFFWFMWDGKYVGLTQYTDHRINAAGLAYGTVAGWLAGRSIGPVQHAGNIVYCPVADAGATTAWLAWTHNYKTARWAPPRHWDADRIESLEGGRMPLPVTGDVELTASPLLIRKRT